ncbi:hypothetical protein TSOC_004927 [Tetrabaena socialis]|uniref:ASCH domain-containing protein n=1 Tax=Tetrabaena socialis TaxID=47790 RepID=A0A2J8A7L5_9CHLO|nr:hypothetical protein TSOC_004927 [Tetrabaena socialis]|eukprot:PNH08524.1 hypothetical protein TSOC_004927 [Tetrabaena socialis]
MELRVGLGGRPPLLRESSLMPRYLELIRCGAKTVEGRVRVGKWADVLSGDLFRFTSSQGPPASPAPSPPPSSPTAAAAPVLVRATTVRHYDSFRAMLEGEGLGACLPGVGSLDEGVEVYRSIPGYREAEGVQGVVGVGVTGVEEGSSC